MMASADVTTAEPGLGTAASTAVTPRKKRGNHTIVGVVAWIVGIVFFFPVLWMVITAFKNEVDASTDTPKIWFKPTLDQFRNVFHAGFWPYAGNSAFATAVSTLLVLALASGVTAFAVGNPGPARIVAVTHGVVGLAVVALIPWKSVVARRGWRRHRPGRGAGLALAVGVFAVLASGLLHTQGGFRQLLVLTPMQLHVGGAAIVLAVLVAHLKVHPTRPRRTEIGRAHV